MQKYKANSFPLKLKMLRLERGKSQEILSAELGISRSCLANYETGKRRPDAAMLGKIAFVLQVDVNYFASLAWFGSAPMQEAGMPSKSHLQELLQSPDETLDISHLSAVSRLSMLTFYDYVKNSWPDVSAPASDATNQSP